MIKPTPLRRENTKLTLFEGTGSHFDKVKREWILSGDDIITCPATNETIDISSCKSPNKGTGCMYLKEGVCKYE